MLKSIAIAICSIGLSTAAFAQTSTSPPTTTPPAATAPKSGSDVTTGSTTKSAADCEASWKTADKNTDGRLDQTEMNSVKSTLPTSLQSASSVTQAQYMTACQGR